MSAIKLPAVPQDEGFSGYLREVWKFPMLTADEEYMLAHRYQDHDDTAAAHKLAHEVANGMLDPGEINEDMLKSRMGSAALPDIDLLIRTGGEQRVSNFMLWDISYAELHFTPALWPDFSTDDLDRALSDFAGRERRFGGNGIVGVSETVTSLAEKRRLS